MTAAGQDLETAAREELDMASLVMSEADYFACFDSNPRAEGDRTHPTSPHKLAHQLLRRSEDQLSDVGQYETFDLIVACIKHAYEHGNLYLLALRRRQAAARSGGTLRLMRWVRVTNAIRGEVASDSQLSVRSMEALD